MTIKILAIMALFTSSYAEEMPQLVKQGKDYVENTSQLLPHNAKAKMRCTSCHLDAGTRTNAGSWIGITRRFPQYRARSGKMDTLSDRINDCFERSMNGKRLEENDPAMRAILSYMDWLSRDGHSQKDAHVSGMPKLALKRSPDLKRGEQVYRSKCAQCHQANGQGLIAPTGQVIFPPLWGPASFNIGAGMARLHTAAGFVKYNMPLGQNLTLSDDEAFDVAAYFTQKDRPDFIRKSKDWPKGERPSDARY